MNSQSQQSAQVQPARHDTDEGGEEHALAAWSRRHDLYGQEKADGGRDVYAEINRALMNNVDAGQEKESGT